jgi:alkylhydroperoxidase family enzyme
MSYNNVEAPALDEVSPLAAEMSVLATSAPEVHAAWLAVCRAADAAIEGELLAATRRRVEVGLGTADEPFDEAPSPTAVAAADITDQFLVYVPGVTPSMLEPLRSDLGVAGLQAFVQTLYVLDQTTRLKLIYAQLFPGDHAPSSESTDNSIPPMDQALSELHAATMRLSGLDPLTTEIIRLRAGSYHQCRLCTSIRLQQAGASVVDEDLVSRIERNDLDGMSAKHQIAMRYADAHMINPKALGQDLVTALHEQYTMAQIIEMTLDVSQWNQQKIIVALGTDTPVSEAGLTPLMFDTAGHIVHGRHGSLG